MNKDQKLAFIRGTSTSCLSTWERSFVTSVLKQYDERRMLTDKQWGIVDRVYNKMNRHPGDWDCDNTWMDMGEEALHG